jgi:hypothetical protein
MVQMGDEPLAISTGTSCRGAMDEVKDAVTKTKKPVHFRIVSTLE